MADLMSFFNAGGLLSVATFSTLIAAIAAMIPSVFALMRSTKKYNKTYGESKNLYDAFLEEKELNKIKIINDATINLPSGLSKDEYFSSLKNVLSEVSYNQYKSTDKNPKDTIEDLIRNHHEQAISQATIQFWFSLIASVVGFVFIIVMIIMANGSEWYVYVLRVLPGTIIEAVSILFFKQSSETRERASDFLNRLRSDDQIAKSIVIADSISDEKLKSSIKAQIALHICGVKETLDQNN